MNRKNTNDFLLISGFGFDKNKDDIPSITPIGGPKLVGKYSTPLLLLCWREHVENIVKIFDPVIDVFLPLAPPKDELNCKFNNADFGYLSSTGVFKERVRDRYPDAKSFVPESWLFSTFLEGVKNGTIDCDKLPIMKKNLQTHFNEAMERYKEIKEKTGSPPPEKYTPKTKDKPRTKREKVFKNSIIPGYVTALSMAFNFTQEEDDKKKKRDLPDIDKKDLSKTFEYYLQKDLVSKVQFKLDKIKQFHLTSEPPKEDDPERVSTPNHPPEDGAAGIILKLKRQQQNEKKEKYKKGKKRGTKRTHSMLLDKVLFGTETRSKKKKITGEELSAQMRKPRTYFSSPPQMLFYIMWKTTQY